MAAGKSLPNLSNRAFEPMTLEDVMPAGVITPLAAEALLKEQHELTAALSLAYQYICALEKKLEIESHTNWLDSHEIIEARGFYGRLFRLTNQMPRTEKGDQTTPWQPQTWFENTNRQEKLQ